MQSSGSAKLLRIGTRGSPLALEQAQQVRDRLLAAHGIAPFDVELVTIRTSGDKIQDRPLAEAGGKGLFAKEIEEALIEGSIDVAVHSAKDLPTILPKGLTVAASLAREDVRDAFISRKAANLRELAAGSTVGTASPRRQALLRRLRPDLRIVSFRGNVETRLRKLDEGLADATVLALAGLKRLNLAAAATAILPTEDFPPAVGQGAIAIETRAGDSAVTDLLAPISDGTTMIALAAERAFLAALDGSCRTPIAGHAMISGELLRFYGLIVRPDGTEAHETRREGAIGAAEVLGADAGRELKRRASTDFFVPG